MPMIIASAVMITGRRRVLPAESAAWCASWPAFRWSFAKVTTRMEFAVATPTLMMEPISEGTLRVVLVTNSIQMIPHRAPGRAMMMMKGSTQDWKFTTSRK